MRILIFPILLISVSVSAQQKIRKQLIPRTTDTMSVYKLDSKKIQPPQKSDQKNLYKTPSAKPKEGTEYSSLKSKKADTTDYKMLNAITPEEPKKDDKKQLPAKSK